MNDMSLFYRLITIAVIALFVSGCATTEDEKKKKIQEKISLVNQKNAKKHGELIIPQFLQNNDYSF